MATMAIVCCSCNKDDDDDDVVSENLYNGKTTAEFNSEVSYGTMTDLDGNTYKTVTIGTQTWMAENLRTTQYNDGTPIPNVTDDDEWAQLTTGAYCNYNNTTNVDTIATFGRLYNWHAVNTEKLAPTGWHVPTDSEWYNTLRDYLGTNCSLELKETGMTHWLDSNTDATNETGFTVLPGGGRLTDGTFNSIGYNGNWLSATNTHPEENLISIWSISSQRAGSNPFDQAIGGSVRCVKD
jgi:uncharacterized protein (TIGR02145 family)